ncbi:50S ribosomal protein L6, partial [Candidatus Peregrinibacteria bacterium]|nr:50S ribosomal protein L6 [Candidatus Peregrinibacteria bacterium]
MSRIGKQPISIPSGVEVRIEKGEVSVKGPKGTLKFSPHNLMQVAVENQSVAVSRKNDSLLGKGLHGLTRTLISNMIVGVTKGYAKQLEIQGVGYRAQVQGKRLDLALGFSHPVVYTAPEGIAFEIDKEKKNIITVYGI